MTTINTIDDLLRIARENEGFRAAMRRELLTEELLALPSQFAAMRETQNAMLETQNRILAELAETRQTQAAMLETQNAMLEEQAEFRRTQNAMLEEQAGFRRTQNAMLEEQAEFRRTQNAMLETQNAILETQNAMLEEQAEFRRTQNAMLEEQREVRGDIKALHGMYRQQHEDFGRFRGNYAVSTMRENDFEIARIFSRLRGFRRIRIRPLTRVELSDMLDDHYDAVDALGLRERAWITFQNPDLIAEITGLRSANTGFYIAVEASYTGDREDTLRATDHAKILRRATGLDSYAVVASVRLGPGVKSGIFNDVSRFVEARDEDAVLWYQLDEEKLEPFDPC